MRSRLVLPTVASSLYKSKVVRGSHDHGTTTQPQGKAVLQVMRFDPTTNSQRIESYEYTKKQDFMVLDLLTAVKAHQDPSLAFRASCCEGVCGSCAMNINGVNSLACVTFASHVTIVGPLPNFPVIKDLVVDLRGFFQQYAFIRPYTRNLNLPRYHIDSIFQRYNATCKALFGQNPERLAAEALEGAIAPEGKTQTEIVALLQVLDRAVSVGDVGKVVTVLKKFKEFGYEVSDEASKKVILNAVNQFEKSS